MPHVHVYAYPLIAGQPDTSPPDNYFPIRGAPGDSNPPYWEEYGLARVL